MSAAIDILQSEHHVMSKLLDLLEHEVGHFERAEPTNYDLIKEIIDYFLTYPDLCHHPRENLILDTLKQRAGDAAAAVTDLDAAHSALSEQLHKFAHTVVNSLLELNVPREHFVELARQFLDSEREHMAHEEKVFFPLAKQHLTAADWRDIDERASRIGGLPDVCEEGLRFPALSAVNVLEA